MLDIVMPAVLLTVLFSLLSLYIAVLLDLLKVPGCVLLTTLPVAMLLYIGAIISPLNELGWYAPYVAVKGLQRNDVVMQLGLPDKIIPAGAPPLRHYPVQTKCEMWLYRTGPRIAQRTFCVFMSEKGRANAVLPTRRYLD